MLKPYHRRAFLLLAIAALEPAAKAPAHADGESLWDLLARNSSPPAPVSLMPFQAGNAAPPTSARLALGPIPGFSLPAPDGSARSLNSIFDKPKNHRRSQFGAIGDWVAHVQNVTGSKITASGQSTLSLRAENISGGQTAQDAYHSDQYFGKGTNGVYNDTSMTVDAQLFKYLHYHTQFSNRFYDNPNDNKVKLDYNTKKVHLEWGNINAGFKGNSLIDFNRYMSGFQVSNEWSPRFRTSLLYSQTRAETRTIVVQGEDKTGPYYIFSGQIVDGSAHVRVDNRDMVEGKDYTLDPYSGILNFTNSNVILHTSTIAITYEAIGYNQQQGSIMGSRLEYTLRPGATFGLTYVSQTAQGSSGLQAYPQQFYGNGTPGEPYSLAQPVDLTKPITVTVDGRPLIKDVDYVVDTSLLNAIRINQAIPISSIIKVAYYPLNVSPTPGNRSIVGLDGQFRLGKYGTVAMEGAMSGLSITGNNVRGTAMQLRASLTPLKKLNTSLTLRDVSPSFSAIQTPGFNRNEKSIDIASDYQFSSRLRFNMDWQRAKRPAYSSGGFGGQFTINSVGNDDYSQYSVGGSYNFARNGSINLTRNDISTKFILGGQSTNSSDTLGVNYGLGKVNMDASLSRTNSDTTSIYNLSAGALGGTTTTGTGQQLYDSNTSTLTKHLGLHWNVLKALTLSGNISDNAIKNNGAGLISSETARNSDISAQVSLFGMRITYAYGLSDTGNVVPQTQATAGTTTNNGANGGVLPITVRSTSRDVTAGGSTPASSVLTNPSGTSPGSLYGGGVNAGLGGSGSYSGYLGNTLNSSYGLNSLGGSSRTHHLGIDFTVPKKMRLGAMHLGMNVDYASSLGDYQYNSTRKGINFTLSWDPREGSDRLHLDATYGTQRILYSGAVGATSNNALTLNLYGHPFGGRLATNLSWQGVRTNSSLNLTAPQATAGTTATTTTSGLTDTSNNISSISLRLEYPINRLLAPFLQMDRSLTSGYLGNIQDNWKFGVDYSLTHELKFSLGWQLISHMYNNVTGTQPNYTTNNYKASTLLAELGVHF